jgi:NADH-quinone oxidoreductase subunit J
MTLFLIASAIALGAGVAMIFQRNSVHAALLLVLNLLSVAVLFLLLGAEFLFVSQIIVYAGAIVILFLFVIMLLGVDRNEVLTEPRPLQRRQFIAAGIAGLVLVASLATAVTRGPLATAPDAAPEGFGTADAIGGQLFQRYLLPFELTGLLLLVATIGILMLAKRPERPSQEER